MSYTGWAALLALTALAIAMLVYHPSISAVTRAIGRAIRAVARELLHAWSIVGVLILAATAITFLLIIYVALYIYEKTFENAYKAIRKGKS